MNTVIPTAVSRRLLLSLIGFRTIDGVWWRDHEHLTEEQVDAMSAQAWSRYVRRWVSSAATTN